MAVLVSHTKFWLAKCAFLTSVASHYKSWKVSGLQPFVALIFTAGYALREAGAFNYQYNGLNKDSLIIYIMNQVLVYIGP